MRYRLQRLCKHHVRRSAAPRPSGARTALTLIYARLCGHCTASVVERIAQEPSVTPRER